MFWMQNIDNILDCKQSIFFFTFRVILGGGVPPSSLNPDPISEQKVSFSTPFVRRDL